MVDSRELAGTFSWPDGGQRAGCRRQAGNGRARNRARAPLNWFSQGHGQQRVVAALASVAVVARPLLGQPVGLADGGIKINGEWCVAGSRPSGPGPGQQLPAHPIQLADVAEAAQERPQGGGRLDHATESASRPAGAQHVGAPSG